MELGQMEESEPALPGSPRESGYWIHGAIAGDRPIIGSFIAFRVVAAIDDFPASLRAWAVWTGLCFFGAVIAIVLSVVGKSRSQIQLLTGTVALSLACVMIVTLA